MVHYRFGTRPTPHFIAFNLYSQQITMNHSLGCTALLLRIPVLLTQYHTSSARPLVSQTKCIQYLDDLLRHFSLSCLWKTPPTWTCSDIHVLILSEASYAYATSFLSLSVNNRHTKPLLLSLQHIPYCHPSTHLSLLSGYQVEH